MLAVAFLFAHQPAVYNSAVKKIVVFGVLGWNIAETTRMIQVAKSSRAFIDAHFVSYGGEFDQLVTQEGFPLHQLTPGDTPEKIEHLWAVARGEKIAYSYPAEEIRLRVKSELALFEKLEPAALVIGSVLTFSISSQVLGIPLVNVMPFPWTRPYLEAGLPALPGLPKNLNRVIAWALLNLPIYSAPFSKIAREYGLPRYRTIPDVWSGDYNFAAEHPLLRPTFPLPRSWQFCDPIFAKLDKEIPKKVKDYIDSSKLPVVYFAMGTSANKKVLMKTLKGFDGLPVSVIAPIAAYLDPTDPIPDNVLVTDWLPALEVSRLVDAAVTHGGAGTVQTSCEAGLPFVGIGMQPEQDINIESVAKYGAAIRLSRRGLTPEKLRVAITAILEDERFKDRAQELITRDDGVTGAAQVASRIESLCA